MSATAATLSPRLLPGLLPGLREGRGLRLRRVVTDGPDTARPLRAHHSPPSNTSQLLPIFKASSALFPSIYISSPVGARAHVESVIALSIRMAEAAAPPGKRRIPVFPFSWCVAHWPLSLSTSASHARHDWIV